MDTRFIIILVLIILSVLFSFFALIFALRASKKDSSKDSAVLESKIDTLSGTVSTEMSNNRREVMQMMDSVNGKIADMSEKNLTVQHKIISSVNESLAEIRNENAKQNEKIMQSLTSSIEKMTEKNEKKLEEMRATVDEKLTSTLTTRLDSSFKTVSEQLEKLYSSLGEMKELSGGITQNVTSLNRVLTNVKARGTWAEYLLEGILDQTVPNMYVKNFQPAGHRDFVEFAVKLPSGDDSKKITYLPIDSKFPMEDYARLCAAADSADALAVAEARKALEKRVLEEAKDVSKYISVPETTPFAIMYLVTEGLYAEIASSKSGLFEKIQNEYSVMIAGPTTITALLNSVAMGLRTMAVNEKANEIKELLSAVKKQYDMFDTVLTKIKKKITEADASIDEATKRNSIIQKKLKGIDAAESLAADEILGITGGSEES
ncbi:MAG: DNA recombination protein RmuC [Clostridia bacterium]|nr:DNA recombination protein RmuC [Clostridia bacterium]